MMDELNRRLSPTGNSSNIENVKSDTHTNSVELDPLTGLTNRSDYSRKLRERTENDIEKLKDGSIHRHRYKLHESNETNKTNQSDSLNSNLPSTSRFNNLPSSTSRINSRLNDLSSTRVRQFLDDDDDLESVTSTRSRYKEKDKYKVKDLDLVGARLASELGIDVKSKPISFNYDCDSKRRAHDLLLKEIDDEDEKFRTLPPKDPFRYKAREQMFHEDWDEKELRYLSKDGRKDLIRPIRPFVQAEQPFKHKRKSLYGKFVEGF